MPGDGDEDRAVTPGKLYVTVGGGIAVSVGVTAFLILMHAATEEKARESDRQQVQEVKAVVREGLSELRGDVKELLRKTR